MRLPRRSRGTTKTRPGCHVCLDSGKVPYVDNHFDLWMVPCQLCHGATATH